MRLAFALAVALAACRSPAPPRDDASTLAAKVETPPPTGDTMALTAETKACIERWIQKHGLNTYGDPPDTMYAGGTPLFDESSGRRTDRYDYILSKHPELKDCKGDGP